MPNRLITADEWGEGLEKAIARGFRRLLREHKYGTKHRGEVISDKAKEIHNG